MSFYFHLPQSLQETINLYCEELIKWNKTTDLVGNSTLSDIKTRHIMDSLQLMPFLYHHDKVILDIGTGAGLPGIICALYDPKRHYILYEKKKQKLVFLKHIMVMLNIQNITIHGSFDPENCPDADVLTSRALLNIHQINPCLSKVKRVILFKGKNVFDELKHQENVICQKGYFKDSYFVTCS